MRVNGTMDMTNITAPYNGSSSGGSAAGMGCEPGPAERFEDMPQRRKSQIMNSFIRSSQTSNDQNAELMAAVMMNRKASSRDFNSKEFLEKAAANAKAASGSGSVEFFGDEQAPSKDEDDLLSDDGVTIIEKEKETKAIQEELSKKESNNVLYLRLLVIGVLIATAAVVSGVVYMITHNGEVKEFENQYEGAAGKVIDAFEGIMVNMESIAGLATAYTSQGMHTHQWPFVSLEDFSPRARNALDISGSLWIGMCPIVPKEYFQAWDSFVLDQANYKWVEQALSYQQRLGIEPVNGESIGVSNVTGYTGVVDPMHYIQKNGTALLESNDQDWYLPRWQTSPFLHKAFVNENLRNKPKEYSRENNKKKVLNHVVSTGMAVATEFYTADPGYANSTNPDTAFLANLRGLQAGLETPYHGDPMTDLYIPIYDVMDDENRKVVGVMSSLVHWKSFFRYVLPQNLHGINAVLEYTCKGAGGGDDDETMTFDDDKKVGGEERRRRRRRRMQKKNNMPEMTVESNPTRGTTFTMMFDDNEDPKTPGTAPTPSDGGRTSVANGGGFTTDPPIAAAAGGAAYDDDDNNNNATTMGGTTHVGDSEKPQDIRGETKYFTIVIEGVEAYAVGHGDQHERKFAKYERRASYVKDKNYKMNDGTYMGVPIDDTCTYELRVYPSQKFYDQFSTSQPYVITLVIAMVFLFAIVVFWVYNLMVEHRQEKILKKATQTTALVSTLFPKNVRDRLLDDGDSAHTNKYGFGTKSRLKGFVAGEQPDTDVASSPIADLFPNCTVFFGDIAGFTAWSSTREPSQVFILLQNLYQTFDQLAKRREVFKVETIGDCYMAVTGLPDPQPNHATLMARFAFDCLVGMTEVTKKLESTLGPDTTDLAMRIGLHSGPVTAGVLRGDRARFQLFGDTVNTASRMESNGMKGRIQVSDATAKILEAAGKRHWLTEREDAIKAKGKGIMKTHWMIPKGRGSSYTTGSSNDDYEDGAETREQELQSQSRLVDWIVSLMLDDIRKIVYDRKYTGGPKHSKHQMAPTYIPPNGTTCMEEVKEVIHMPKFDSNRKAHQMGKYKDVAVDDEVVQELTDYVGAIASMYRDNPFHNFEHACHVTMSVNKLLKRIVTPEIAANEIKGSKQASALAMRLHDYTYGINSDPLAMFAMTFSALIHDVDHRGVSNMQLGVEEPEMARKYEQKSVAEQNSLDLSWDILMEDRFKRLRSFVFVSQEELLRFRQLIVNIVLATDIFDKELNDLRKNRWKHAFSGEKMEEDERTQNDLRATIVIEHIIQASDVSHTMQHWHVYQKWNKQLFKEMHRAFQDGRMGKDPASFWYKGEIGFFDNYIIPLAKKLHDCGVFGVSSDEYLDYAQQNRAEWEERGEEIVMGLVEELKAKKKKEDKALAEDRALSTLS